MKLRLASTCVLALGVLAFAGSASAGTDDKGKPDGAGGVSAVVGQASAPGNSANAPGQMKKEAEGDAQQDVEAATTAAPAAVAGSSGGNVGSRVGVKPASETEKDTHEAASSDKTKQYGNGKTAGQIAMQNGAPAATILHGPGNSQPHKAAPCSGGHEVDVHALKGKRLAKLCGPASPPGPNPNPGPGPGSNRGGSSNGGGNSQSSGNSTAGAVTNPAGPNGSPAGPGPSSGGSNVQAAGGSEGVLAETGVAGQSGSLPFTGFPIWMALFVGTGMILAGLLLLRRTEVAN